MASISGNVTIAGDPDDWIACAFDAATHAFAGVAAVSGGAYEITGLTAGKAYVVACRPKSGAVWQPNSTSYTTGDLIVPADTAATPYIFKAEIFGAIDPFYDDVTLVIPCNGADATTTFTDAKGHTVTVSGNAQVDTDYAKYGGGSALFDVDGDRINVASSVDFSWGTGDFCIEFWARFVTDTHPGYFFSSGYNVNRHLYFSFNNSNNKIAAVGTGFSTITASSGLSLDAWHHIAFTRHSGNTKLFVDGESVGSGTSTADFSENQPLYFGGTDSNIAGEGNWGKCHLDDIRVTNLARYWENFTPPAASHPTASIETGETEPTWPTTPGNTVVDGDVIWTNMGALIDPIMRGPVIAA
jgi:hypothetical protein